jgi:putative hydrolase of the HAD superfamily
LPTRFIDGFDTILLDLNGTFMFGHDRYGLEQDYHATYRALGGSRLSADEVRDWMTRCWDVMNRAYLDPARFDDQPTAVQTMRALGVEPEEVEALAAVFCEHERGEVPAEYVDAILGLATTHRLGVVSNLWAPAGPYREHFEAVGLGAAFTCAVFSSDDGRVKPSPHIFRRALAAFPVDARILFVGDSLERDVIPAKELGMGTAWITASSDSHPAADLTIPTLLELSTAGAPTSPE